MSTSPSRRHRRAAQKPAKPAAASIGAEGVNEPAAEQVALPIVPADIESYHKALLQKQAELVGFLQQIQAKSQEVVGQINQVAGEVRAVEMIKQIQAAGAKSEPAPAAVPAGATS